MNCSCWSKRSNNRFICVGVDISIYALLAGERSSYSPVLSHVLYPHSVVLCVFSGVIGVYKCYIGLPSARSCAVEGDNNKDMCVDHLKKKRKKRTSQAFYRTTRSALSWGVCATTKPGVACPRQLQKDDRRENACPPVAYISDLIRVQDPQLRW